MITCTSTWKKLEECGDVPMFTMPNMMTYFVMRKALDGRQANDFKNINSHAFPLFKSGHIQSIKICSDVAQHHYTCLCLPEMKKNTVYKIELRLDGCSDIISAKCECPAGIGPRGSCKHIAAFCYSIKEFVRIKSLESCMDREQVWNHQPRKRRLQPREVTDIAFVKKEYGKEKTAKVPHHYDPRPQPLRHTSEEEIVEFKGRLTDIGSNAAFLHVLGPPTQIPLPSPLPPSPHIVRERVMQELKLQAAPLSINNTVDAGKFFLKQISYSQEVVENSKKETEDQNLCKQWHEERAYRLTASRFGSIAKRRAPCPPLAKNILYGGNKPISNAAMQWGRDHERTAIECFTCSSPDLKVVKCGIVVAECGFLGASPDAVVENSSGEEVCVIEVKYPYSARESTVVEACSISFFCELVGGRPTLK